MKKILCVVLVAVLLFLCGCAGKDNRSAVLSPVMKEYLESIDNFEVPVHEYGEERSNLFFGEKLVVGVFYPDVGINKMDNSIKNWVSETVSEYQTEVASYNTEAGEKSSELTVNYESFLTYDKYISVKMTGFFNSPFLAHPIEIIETFNGNADTEEVLRLDELLSENGRENLIKMLTGEVQIDEDLLDDKILDKWLITRDGIEIILPQGQYLPMSDGTKTVLFKFDELSGIIKSSVVSGIEEKNEVEVVKPQKESSYIEKEDKNKTKIDTTKPVIALTFDDGPSAHTERLLDIFKSNGGKGTFFVIGNMIDNRSETVKRIVADGHEIAGHSWSHRQLTNLSEEEIKDQIMSTRAKIYDLTGYDTKLVRPPYGAFNDTVKAVAEELDVALINWSVDTLDWKYKNENAVYECIMKEACDGAIILCHDLHETTVNAMEKVIPALLNKGYQLVTVSELFEAKGKYAVAGNVYFSG